MTGAMGFWDALFGEKIEIGLPDGSRRRVTKKWFDKMVRQGKARPVSASEVLRSASSAADAQIASLLQSTSEHSDDLGTQILLISLHEVGVLMDVWDRELDDETQVYLFAEYSAFLITYVDRLALGKFGDPKRSDFMNAVIDRVKRGFTNQRHLGRTELERDAYFENLIAERLADYSSSTDMGSHVFAGARLMVESFCDHVPESEWPSMAIETGKSMSKATVSAVAVLPAFKALLKG